MRRYGMMTTVVDGLEVCGEVQRAKSENPSLTALQVGNETLRSRRGGIR